MDRQSKCVALEKKHVHDVYDKTAHHFRDVRYKAWPRVKQFLMSLEPASLVADVGCGSGKYLSINRNLFKVGCDRSGPLVDIAHARHHAVLLCDNLRLPYRDAAFDAVISIGVIHHLTTSGRRVQALRELARVLRPGGKLMVYVWAMEQRHRQFEAQDVLVPWNFQATVKHKRKKGASQLRNMRSETLSDDEGSTGDSRQTPGHYVTPVNRCRGLRHHKLGEGVKIRNQNCQQRRRTFHKQRDLVHLDSTHSRDGGSSSCWSTTSVSMDASSSLTSLSMDSKGDNNLAVMSNKGFSSPGRQNSLKNWVVNLFSNPLKRDDQEGQRLRTPLWSRRKLKDYEYKELICQIVKEDIEMYKRQRPFLEHSQSAPEHDTFAVREFPQSSQPEFRKIQSLDEKRHNTNPNCAMLINKNLRAEGMLRDCATANDASQESNGEPEPTCNGSNVAGPISRVIGLDNVRDNACSFAYKGLVKERPNECHQCQSIDRKSHLCSINGGQACHHHSLTDKIDKTSLTTTPDEKVEVGLGVAQRLPNARSSPKKNGNETNSGATIETLLDNFGCAQEKLTVQNRDLTGDGLGERTARTYPTSNGAGVSLFIDQAQYNSSPESPSCEFELNSPVESPEGSSLSSPEDDQPQHVDTQVAVTQMLENVDDVPSHDENAADEWAKVTINAIRLMQTEVLRKTGSSMDSLSSRLAVMGSSMDFQDTDDGDDDDPHSPMWLDAEPGVPMKQRFPQHGSYESSSLSSDPFTESEEELGGGSMRCAGDGSIRDQRMMSSSPQSPNLTTGCQNRRDTFLTVVEKKLGTGAKSDLWNRRRALRRFHSLSEHPEVTLPMPSQPPLVEKLHKVHPLHYMPLPDTQLKSATTQVTNLPSPKAAKAQSPVMPKSEEPLPMDSFTDLPRAGSEEPFDSAPSMEADDSSAEATYHRYYHVFREGELVSLVEKHVEHLHILDSYYDNANWCIVAEKVRVWHV